MTISGRDYACDDVLARPSLNDLYALRLATGIGLGQVYVGLTRIDKLPKSFNSIHAIADDLDLLAAFRAYVWLVRRFHGETLTVDEANDFPMTEFAVRAGEPDEGDAVDPSEPATGSAPAAAGAPVEKQRRRTSSTTSAKRSRAASSR